MGRYWDILQQMGTAQRGWRGEGVASRIERGLQVGAQKGPGPKNQEPRKTQNRIQRTVLGRVPKLQEHHKYQKKRVLGRCRARKKQELVLVPGWPPSKKQVSLFGGVMHRAKPREEKPIDLVLGWAPRRKRGTSLRG